MRSLAFLVTVLLGLVLCQSALGDEQLLADPQRSYDLETEISATVTVHGNQRVLQAEFPRGDVLGTGLEVHKVTLRPKRAQLHLGTHVDVAFRVPAGPPVPPASRNHVSYAVTNLQVSFAPSPDPRRRELLVRLTAFVANGKTCRVEGPAGRT